ncbi:MAG: ABC transporter permease [Candidatus Sericytochromatia bacterium]
MAHSVNIVTQFWFWLTPLIYPITVVPEEYRWLLLANPMLPVAQGYQQIFLHGRLPEWGTLAAPAVCAVVALVGGYLVFSKLSKEMVDEL